MGILNKYEIFETVNKSSGMFIKDVDYNEIRPIGNDGFSMSYEYELHVKLGTRFSANSAQLDAAKLYALDALTHYIYGDILSLLPALKSAVFSRNTEYAMKLINDIESNIKN